MLLAVHSDDSKGTKEAIPATHRMVIMNRPAVFAMYLGLLLAASTVAG